MAGYLEDPAIFRFYFRFRARIAIRFTGTLATEMDKSYVIDELLLLSLGMSLGSLGSTGEAFDHLPVREAFDDLLLNLVWILSASV